MHAHCPIPVYSSQVIPEAERFCLFCIRYRIFPTGSTRLQVKSVLPIVDLKKQTRIQIVLFGYIRDIEHTGHWLYTLLIFLFMCKGLIRYRAIEENPHSANKMLDS